MAEATLAEDGFLVDNRLLVRIAPLSSQSSPAMAVVPAMAFTPGA